MTADQFKVFKETKQDEFEAFVDSLMFKEVNLMVRGKYQTYNGETKMKYFAVIVLPQRNIKSENDCLFSLLLFEYILSKQ